MAMTDLGREFQHSGNGMFRHTVHLGSKRSFGPSRRSVDWPQNFPSFRPFGFIRL